jgi:hypothetical protein
MEFFSYWKYLKYSAFFCIILYRIGEYLWRIKKDLLL